jgi:secondary thiamine-phosphate synthase enzyme
VEYEPGLLQDIPDMLEKFAPSGEVYQHNETWHDGNGHSHLRATLIKPSLTIPFVDQTLTLGTWQQVILLDFDNRPRQREVVVQFIGI